ncbi:MAG: hypothetical protein E4H13_03535 [Calditrichales bacterium]|nr:MAG: hypothetical protein E4H13_03535 [Calditrichales bacterium]
MSIQNILHENYTVRSYEMDLRGKASVPTICNYLQESAGNHATKLGVSVLELFKKNQTWVLSRLHVKILKYPNWRETVTMETWPSVRQGRFAIRDFIIFNQESEPLIKASSSWMVLDLKTLRPITLPEEVTQINVPDKPRAIDTDFPKLSLPENAEPVNELGVRLGDLDINRHVNNVTYVEWALESLPISIWKKSELAELEISYRAETKYGERVIVHADHVADSYTHLISSAGDKRNLAVVKTLWRDIQHD